MTRIRRERADTRGRIRTHASIIGRCITSILLSTHTQLLRAKRVQKLRTTADDDTETTRTRQHPQTHPCRRSKLAFYILPLLRLRYEDIRGQKTERKKGTEKICLYKGVLPSRGSKLDLREHNQGGWHDHSEVNENLLTVDLPVNKSILGPGEDKTKNSTTRKKLASTACTKRTLCSQSMTTPGLPSKERGCTYPLFCVRPERSESPSCAAAKLHANPVGNTQRFALVGLCAPD